jgi:hypothetical protein
MDRRTAIRTLATATALPVLAPSDAAALLEARRMLGQAGYLPAALTRRELEIVGLVADIILPRTDTPGATDVGVPAFVDLIVSEWMDEDDAEVMHAGLAALDDEARTRFGDGFVECAADDRLALVASLDAQLPVPGEDGEPPEGFYPTLKRLVITGYFTTETGASQTGYRITPGTFEGCVAAGGSR